jgi:hypothetical protein
MFYRSLYWLFVLVGRPFGGIRPRRITHWLQGRGFGAVKPATSDFRWYRDDDGHEWLLHPHFHIDHISSRSTNSSRHWPSALTAMSAPGWFASTPALIWG